MKSIILDKNSNFKYLISKPFSCQYLTDDVSNFSSDLVIDNNFVSNNFELVSDEIKQISNVWQDNNHNIFIYDKSSGYLWKITSDDHLSIINSNFKSVIDNLHNISDQVYSDDLKYSTYNNCFYVSCQPNADDSFRLRVLTLTGNDYSIIDQGAYIDGWFSRGRSEIYEYTYEGPYCVVVQSYVNNYDKNTLKYNPKFILYISNNNRSSWTNITKQVNDKDDFGADVSVSSYNGTYYVFDHKGWYFNQTLPTLAVTTNPNNLANIITSNIFSTFGPITFRKEGNYLVSSDCCFSSDTHTFVKNNESTYQLSPYSNKFYSSIGSDQEQDYVYDIYDFSENNIGSDIKISVNRKCYAERGSRPFQLYKSDTALLDQCSFFTNNYMYQLNSKGLVRCHVKNLVTRQE